MKKESIIRIFPQKMRPYFCEMAKHMENLNEIRIRADKPVLIIRGGEEYFLLKSGQEILAKAPEQPGDLGHFHVLEAEKLILTQQQTEQLFSHICQNSPYAYEEELKKGFITISGGHRVGVAGQIIAEGAKVVSIRNIRFLNIRITHEITGCAEGVIDKLYNERGGIHNTLIIGSPAFGKTTLMRDVIRLISNGNSQHQGVTVGLVDERSEIAGCFYGVPQNDVGVRTDVLDNCPKVCGMEMLLRSMSPKVIAVDELGGEEDVSALLKVMYAGIQVIVTIHGDNLEMLLKKDYLKPLFSGCFFTRFLILKSKYQIMVLDEKGNAL